MLKLQGYQVLRQIYESANSEVYRAIREADGERVILKVLKQDYPTPAELTRYKQEYEVTRTLNQEGVIKAYGLEKYHNTLVMFIEDFGGESLRILKQTYQFSLDEFLSIALKLATSLGEIHAANIIHKDINPANILFCQETQQLKIIDFGISTRLTRENPTLKNPNVLEGTLPYISPEQTGRMNRSLDYRTDFYSLGITFYELLTGQLPFQTDDDLELVHCHIAKQPLSPSEINLLIPQVISNIVMKLMAKNAEERYQSAWGLKADLETCLKQLQLKGNIENFTLATQDISAQFHIPQKLYGREIEIETLLKHFDKFSQLSEKLAGVKLMLIAGYSGIGKSALVREIYKPITEQRGYFIAGKFDQFQRNIPYSAVVKALEGLIKQLLTEAAAELNQWREQLLASLGANGQVIIDVIPEIELIIGKQPAVPELGANESQNRFNFVFQNFIKVFTQPEHPLALFLDDLQWADGASLKLIQLLMSGDAKGLFLIGAYRDNEVSPAHPLRLTLDEISKNGGIIERVFLSPLNLVTVAQLISDALKTTPENVKSLAELVLSKTGGNPFFINEFLQSLYAEDLLWFDVKSISWCWNLTDIENRKFTDNVVELMISKLKKLPPKTQDILKIGAAIGNQFDLTLVSGFESTHLRDIINSLDMAVSENLVMPLDTRENIELALLKIPNHKLPEYKFVHDRIQQAAYALILEPEKPQTHLKIGQQLLETLSEQHREEKIFDIVNNLNLGKKLITIQSERDALAKLNLLAGQKAKIATAYHAAVEYLNVGIKLLSADSWQSQYHLTLSLYSEAVEAAYLNGNYEEMEKFAEVVIKEAKTLLEKVKIYEVKIQTSMAQTKQQDAVKIGLEALNLMGISLPPSPTPLDIQQALLETNSCLNGKTIDDLLHLPLVREPEHLAMMRLLSNMGSPTFQAAPTLFPLIVLSMVNLSVKQGNSVFSPYAYACYGVILNGVLLEMDSAYNFGHLALILVNKLNALKFKTQINFVAGSCTVHGKVHAKETLSILSEGYQSGLENGQLEYGGYAAMQKCQYSYFIGQELTELASEMAITSYSLTQLKQNNALSWNQIFQQAVLNLRETSNNPCDLLGEAYNEQKSLPMLKQANDRTGLHYFYVNKLILCYLFGEDQQALENTIAAANYLDGVTAFLVVPVFHFYDSLVRLVVYPFVSKTEQDCLLNIVQANQEKMRKWADHAPMNFQHKFDLVEAEKCRVLGQNLEAIDLYDQAIQGAKENHYINDMAIAYELAAKFYLSLGKELTARAYMQEARYFYELWGATAKVKDLEQKYPQLLTLRSTNHRIKGTTKTRTSTEVDGSATLDLATVMKASQAISGEIVLEKLLVCLMKIIIENAGAQVGYLALETQGELLIEASGVGNQDNIMTLQSIPIENYLPVTLINYVARLKEDLVLNDATREGNFVNDPYIITHQPKSILCTPLLNQGQLIGIVYLENNLTTGAFTTDRLEVIKLLSGQAAISLENARLYQTLENKVTERTTQLAEANQEISTLNDKLKAENLRLSAELDVAKKIQEMVLPKPSELEVIEGLDIAGYMEPADEVGGDYYDILSSQNQVKIAIGDVTGHGLESGVLMLMVQTAVRTLQKMDETDHVRFLDILNQTLYENLQRMNSDKNLTLAILDYVDGVVKLSGQHEDMIVVRFDGTIEKIDTIDLGFPIGLNAEIADFIDQKTVRLDSQDVVVLYTDGITEAENIDQELYGLEKLCQSVKQNRQLSAPEIRQAVINDLRQFIGSQKVFDDITLVVLKQK